MVARSISGVLLALTLAACGSAPVAEAPVTPVTQTAKVEAPAPGDRRVTMEWGGKQRVFELHAPPAFSAGGAKLPLVVVMHYRDGTVKTMRDMTRFDAKADGEGFLVAYPQGLNGALNALVCCGSNDDVGFIRSMVETLVAQWNVDSTRVYATGISNGADMAFRLAVELPGMFAAIAPVSGGFVGQKAVDEPNFKPAKKVSVIAFAGNDDRIMVSLVGGMRAWFRKQGRSEKEPVWVDAGKTVNVSTATCADGSETAFYTVNGMGHAWPGGTNAGLGDPKAQINAVDTMWTFFKSH
jgi:polyhydroxybutyrate depolymerase